MTTQEFGSLAEETARFVSVLINAAGQPSQPSPTDGTGSGGGADEVCRWCPICRCAHVLIGTNPEIRAHLLAAATSLAQAWVLAVAQPTAGSTSRTGRPGAAGFEHIDLDTDLENGLDLEDGLDFDADPQEAP